MTQLMRTIRGLTVGAFSFIYLIFVLNPIQCLSILVLPFSAPLCRRINRWCARSIWGLWVVLAERMNNIDVRLSGDALPRGENAIVICNHQSMTDVMALICVAWRCGRISDVKWFVKDIIKFVPGVGWGMWFLDCVFVKRDWMRDKASIERTFSKYIDNDIPLFLISFLEGTRKTPDKWAESQAFAHERGLYVPQHTMVPRTKGFAATVQGLRTHVDAVYDITIGYPDGDPPSPFSCYAARVDRLEMRLQRHPIDTLPEGADALADWAQARFREKDEHLAQFATTGRFPGERIMGTIKSADWFRPE
jgi:1-acyl-sn-glycerol-3-phosphate acyltransferase